MDETALKRYLRETGTTQAWLAAQADVTQDTLCNWASGRTKISAVQMEKILTALRRRAEVDLMPLVEMTAGYKRLLPLGMRRNSGTPYDQFLQRAS